MKTTKSGNLLLTDYKDINERIEKLDDLMCFNRSRFHQIEKNNFIDKFFNVMNKMIGKFNSIDNKTHQEQMKESFEQFTIHINDSLEGWIKNLEELYKKES